MHRASAARSVCLAAAIAVAPPVSAIAFAQDVTASAPAPTIGAVQVVGAELIGNALLAPVLEQAIGQEAQPDILRQLTTGIVRTARDQGYIFASAVVPPQNVRIGLVTVDFDAGKIDEVRIEGTRNRKVRAILTRLEGRAARKKEVATQIALADDVPGIIVNSDRFVRENGRGVLIVSVREDRLSASVSADNWGSDRYGPVRVRLNVDATGLFDDGDVLSAQILSTAAQPDELAYGSLSYSAMIGASGLVVGATIAIGHTQPGGDLSAVGLSGDSLFLASRVSFPLKRTGDSSIWINSELAYLRVRQDVLDTLVQRDDTASLTITVTGSQKVAGGRFNWGIGVVQGLDVLGASHANDLLLSRPDGSGVFTRAIGWFNWYGELTDRIGLRLAGTAQIASRPLLASQELSFGGPYFGRAYDFAERFGDEGVIGLIELRHKIALPVPAFKWGHVYGFADGGRVSNKRHGFGSGTLYSAGGGMRAGIGPMEFGVEGALPLNTDRAETADRSPSVNLSVNFSL